MHGFRDRPLTWLFIAATICVDLVMILPMLFPSAELADYFPKLIVSVGVPVQLSLVAIWAATSEGYRLVRGAALTAAVYGAIVSALLFGLPRQEVALHFLAPVLVVWIATLAMRLLGLVPEWSSRDTINGVTGLVEAPAGDEALERLRPWQFSLVELFGWTCIVALWAYAAHHAILAPYGPIWLAHAVVVPLLMVVLLGGAGSWWLRGGCVGLVMLLVLLVQWGNGIAVLSVIYLIQAAYLALWYAVRRLDRR